VKQQHSHQIDFCDISYWYFYLNFSDKNNRHVAGRPTYICGNILPLLVFLMETDCPFCGVQAEAKETVVDLNIIEHDHL
jgi:hypothetical protein